MARLFAAALAANLGVGALGLLFVWFRTRDLAVVDAAALGQQTDPALQELLRSDVTGASNAFWLVVVAAALISSFVWLLIAQFRKPATPQQARGAGLAWWLELLAVVVVSLVAGFFLWRNGNAAGDWKTLLLALGVFGGMLAYYLATSLGVKRSMIPSVPLASLFRR